VRACVLTLRRKISLGDPDCIVKTITGAGYTVEAEKEAQ
jgi:DNA-binding response OmpR family regulator